MTSKNTFMQEKSLFSLVNLQRYVYLSILFFLPTQFGKHFWPDFAFVGGLRIDYLSPTLFFTDILVIVLFVLFLFSRPAFPKIAFTKNIFFTLLFSICLICGILFSKNPLAGVLGLVKLLEMGFFGWYTARFFGTTIPLKQAFFAVALSVFSQSLLAIAQFWTRGSLGGLFYFFGERSFSTLTPGIANASIQGRLILRPYGTLPHPNVLAGFLLLGMLFVSGVWHTYKTRVATIVTGVTLLLGIAALLVSLGRIPILLFVGIVLLSSGFMLFKKLSKPLLVGIFCIGSIVGIGLLATPLFGRFASTSFLEEAFLVRADLALNAWWMIQAHPLFGVGIQNFLPNLPQDLSSWSYFTRMQPVHNIYLLFFAELGIVAGGIVLYFLWQTLRHVYTSPRSFWQTTVFLMLITMLILGLFDHYLLTVQQGRLLFAFVVGLCWSLPQKSNHKHILKKSKYQISKSKNTDKR